MRQQPKKSLCRKIAERFQGGYDKAHTRSEPQKITIKKVKIECSHSNK